MLGPAPAPCDMDGFGAIMVFLGNILGNLSDLHGLVLQWRDEGLKFATS